MRGHLNSLMLLLRCKFAPSSCHPHATLSRSVSHQPIKCTAPPLLSLFLLRYYWGPQTQTPTSTPTLSILDLSNQ